MIAMLLSILLFYKKDYYKIQINLTQLNWTHIVAA